jgi:MFS family permease
MNNHALSSFGAFTLLCLSCLTIMVGCIIVPGLPGIAPQLGVGNAASWLITLPSLGVVLFGASAGRLIAKLGAFRAVCLGLVSYGVLGVGGALLHGYVAVFIDRILLGGATAIVMAGGTTLLSEFYRGEERLKMIARQGMAIELGGVVFLMLGGLLTHWGWAAPFALYLAAIVILMMVLATIPREAPAPEHTGEHHTSQGASVNPVFAAALLSMVCFFTAVIVLPFRLSADNGELHFDQAQVGYFLAYVSLVAVAVAACMPVVVKQRGAATTLTIAFGLYALAHIAFASATGLSIMLLGGLGLGAGFGLSIPLANHLTIERSAVHKRGQNLAYLSVAIFLGQFLSSFMEFVPGGHTITFMAAAALALVTGVVFRRYARWVDK